MSDPLVHELDTPHAIAEDSPISEEDAFSGASAPQAGPDAILEDPPAKLDVPEFIDQFRQIVDTTPLTGTFCASDFSDVVLNPGLEIDGVGPVGLPISPSCVEAIARVATPCLIPEGILDAGQASGTFELSRDAFRCRNPAWDLQLSIFVKDAIAAFGLATTQFEVRAEAHKCLFWKEGLSFVPTSSAFDDGLFGTLAVCLPVKHHGGDWLFQRRGESHRFCTSNTSEFGFSWAVWSPFTTLHANPVISGHRIILIYNLIHLPSARILAAQESGPGQLKRCLQQWSGWSDRMTYYLHKQGLPPSQWFSHVLPPTEDQPHLDLGMPAIFQLLSQIFYSCHHLRLSTLEEQDRELVNDLRDACVSSGCCLLLGILKIEVSGRIDPQHRRSSLKTFSRLAQDCRTDYILRNVLDVDGELVIDAFKTNPRLCSYDVGIDHDPDDVHLQAHQYTDTLPRFVQIYRHTIAIIVPRSFYIPLLLHSIKMGRTRSGKVLEYVHDKFRASQNSQVLRGQLKELCAIIVANDTLLEELWEDVAGVGMELGEYQYTVTALNDRREVSEELTELIRDAVYRDGVDHLQPVLDQFLKPRFASVADHIAMLLCLSEPSEEGGRQHTPEKAAAWYDAAWRTLLDRLEQESNLVEADARTLAHIVVSLTESDFARCILRIVEQKVTSTNFDISFIAALLPLREQAVILDSDAITTACKGIVAEMIRSFTMFTKTPDERRPRHIAGKPYLALSYPYNKEDFLDPNQVVYLIEQFLIVGYDVTELLDALHTNIRDVSGLEAAWALSTFLIPLLVKLCGSLDLNIGGIYTPIATAVPDFIIRVLTTSITSRIHNRPLPPSDWRQSLPGLDTCCKDCEQLRLFVEDPVAITQDFKMGEKRRLHLLCKLNDAFKYEMVSSTYPNSLRVTKTDRWYPRQRRDWSERLEECRRELHCLDRESPLRKVIGDDAYRGLLLLVTDNTEPDSVVRDPFGPWSRLPTHAGSGTGARVPSGVKRSSIPWKRPFIDLSNG
ncbi:uncharacterized protein BDV14DRAFT_171208 [Aspergillus stella-maris]|uniref:uncharacterized protein n=1 Tax=Aspergillus stella-maris TaxID=1810926 RepID=UPI003CCD8EB5